MGKYAKAIVAALIAGASVLLTGLDDDVVTRMEWISVLIAGLSALGITYAVPNSKPLPESARHLN
ncbi:hypothetical protein Rhe02_55050 [Rhizocola hellebori]|uniref:Holin n=1 Tax=Rhizocola hellebori TaxID=1392758 RepID=A0A8J3VIY6_9ACTN|nr:hypothetical protein [Rhizocola hellebori]GIH07438.1 hypothetical protein Rhe02_55050 [Rhizocola hellebori]